jgi:hypothetical protein
LVEQTVELSVELLGGMSIELSVELPVESLAMK